MNKNNISVLNPQYNVIMLSQNKITIECSEMKNINDKRCMRQSLQLIQQDFKCSSIEKMTVTFSTFKEVHLITFLEVKNSIKKRIVKRLHNRKVN